MLVEMHAHVIYDVDDGAKTQEDMQKMLYSAERGGVKHLVCTSHISPGAREFPMEKYRQHFEEAQAWCRENAPELTLHTGAEIYYTEQTKQLLAAGSVPTLDNSRWILVEFLPSAPEPEIRSALQSLQDAGWQVILAHVERCRKIKLKHAQALKQQGVLLQMNAQSVFDEQQGFFERRKVRGMLENGLIDFVSSDAHNPVSRPFCLEYAMHWLTEHCGQDAAEALCGGNFADKMGWK